MTEFNVVMTMGNNRKHVILYERNTQSAQQRAMHENIGWVVVDIY